MAIMGQITTEASANLVTYLGDPSVAGSILIRSWPYTAVNAASGATIQSLVEALNLVGSYTDPQANGKTYTGKYVNAEVRGDDQNTDGTADRAGVIVQKLIKVTAISAYTDLTNPLIVQNNLIVFPLRTEDGEADQIEYIYPNLDPASQTFLIETITDAQLVLLVGAGWTYVSRDFKKQKDNTATFSFMLKKYTSGATSGDATDEIITERVQAAVGRRNIDIRVKEKVKASVADSIMSSNTGWAIPANYLLLKLRRVNRDDGTADIHQISIRPYTTASFSTNVTDIFAVEYWGTGITHESDHGKQFQREFTKHVEALYTNTLQNAIEWSSKVVILPIETWPLTSYMWTVNPTEKDMLAWGYFEQRTRGDYRNIAHRCSKDLVAQRRVQGEYTPS